MRTASPSGYNPFKWQPCYVNRHTSPFLLWHTKVVWVALLLCVFSIHRIIEEEPLDEHLQMNSTSTDEARGGGIQIGGGISKYNQHPMTKNSELSSSVPNGLYSSSSTTYSNFSRSNKKSGEKKDRKSQPWPSRKFDILTLLFFGIGDASPSQFFDIISDWKAIVSS